MRRARIQRISLAVLAAVGVAPGGGCWMRRADPRPAQPVAAGPPVLHVTNWLTEAVDVHMVGRGPERLLTHVDGRGEARVPVSGVMTDSMVTLRATTAGGARTFTRDSVRVRGTYHWNVP